MSTANPLPLWTLGELMEKARRDAKVSTSEMALYFGVHRKTINNWEAGRTHPSRADIRTWAERCNQPWFTLEGIRDLLGGDFRWITDPAVQLSLFDDDSVPSSTALADVA